MKRNLLLFVFSIITFWSLNAQEIQTSEEDLVRQSFEKYKEAILNNNGEEAIKYLDQNTIDYYTKMIALVKKGDARELNIMDKFLVVISRHKIPKEEIDKINTGEEFIIAGVKEGLIGEESVLKQSIGEVKVDGNKAKGNLLMNGQPIPFNFNFNKKEASLEEGKAIWTLDLTSFFPVANMGFKKVIADSGMEEDEFILYAIGLSSEKQVSKDIWVW